MRNRDAEAHLKRSWKEYFKDPSQWRDNRNSKKKPHDPDFCHRLTKECLWMDRPNTPRWVNDLFILASEECKDLEVGTDGKNPLNLASGEFKAQWNLENHVTEEFKAQRNLGNLVSDESRVLPVVLNGMYLAKVRDSGEFRVRRNLENLSFNESKARRNLENLTSEESEAALDFFQCQRNLEQLTYEKGLSSLDDFLKPHSFEELIHIVDKCRQEKDINNALCVLAYVSEKRLNIDLTLGNSLIYVFVEVGKIRDAEHIFDMMEHHDEKAWRFLIQGYVKHGEPQKALALCQRMQEKANDDLQLSLHTFVAIIKACSQLRDLKRGSEIHEQIKKKSILEKDAFIGSTLIDMYVKCGSISQAEEVFDKILVHDVVSWTALIGGYVEQGCAEEAINLFTQMQQQGVIPDSVTIVYILKACGILGATKKVCRLIKEVFEKLPSEQTIFWNALISGYVEHRHAEEALSCLHHMKDNGISPDITSFVCFLKACSIIRSINKGHEIYAEVSKRGWENDVCISSALVDLNAKCGLLAEAQNVFGRLPVREIVSWNALMTGLVEHGHNEDALRCFHQIREGDVRPDLVTYLCCLKACSSTGNIHKGHEIHAEIAREGLEGNMIVGTTLIDMYSNFGLIAKSYIVFDNLFVRDIVSWNTLIMGCVGHGNANAAIKYFDYMKFEGIIPHIATFLSILKACSSLGWINRGEEIHAEIVMKGLERDLFVGSSLVDMYAKCGFLETAKQVFNTLPNHDVVSWNALIAGFTEYGCTEEALNYFLKMQCKGFPPDDFTFSCVLKSCATIGSSEKSQELHAEITRKGLERDLIVGSTLIGAYSKCGSAAEAQDVFTLLPIRDVIAWTTLMAGYGLQLGKTENAIHVLDEMIKEGIKPNLVTFVGVLNACSHAGLVSEGEIYFKEIRNNGGFILTPEHCTCMVDLLGRAGHIDKAIALIKKMPFHPSAVVWHSLLGACRKWGHVEFGKLAFENAVFLDEMNAAAYICMSNIYAEGTIE